MDQPLVSILTPTYNHARYISECIESVLQQDYQNWELIVIDDGSTDETATFADSYRDFRVKVLREKHRGISRLKETLDVGLKEAKGDLILVLEGDDFLPRYRLSIQVPVFNLYPSVVGSWGKVGFIDAETNRLFHIEPYIDFNKLPYEGFIRLMLQGCFIPEQSVMVRKNSLNAVGGFQQGIHNYCVDYPTWLMLLSIGRFMFLDALLGYWRVHRDSVSHKYAKFARLDIDAVNFFRGLPRDIRKRTWFTETSLRLAWLLRRSRFIRYAFKKSRLGESQCFILY